MIVMLHGNFGEDIVNNFWAFDHPRFNFQKDLVQDFLPVISFPFHPFFQRTEEEEKLKREETWSNYLFVALLSFPTSEGLTSEAIIECSFFLTDVVTKPNQFYLYSTFKTNSLFPCSLWKLFTSPDCFFPSYYSPPRSSWHSPWPVSNYPKCIHRTHQKVNGELKS